MSWYDYLAHFMAGAFLANGVPHFVQGICGNKFQTPFARPRGVGDSSALVNVIWGWFNLLIGGALLRIFLPPMPPPRACAQQRSTSMRVPCRSAVCTSSPF
jgi:hypothetical protein